MENYEEKYKDLIARLQKAKENDDVCDERYCCVIDGIAPELKEAEGERIRKELIKETKGSEVRLFETVTNDEFVAWLEKQGEQKEYTFKSIPRLLDMIEPSDKAKAYCQKLIDTLAKEGYNTDAKIVSEVLKGWNGEDVPMAVMDEQTPVWSEEDEKNLRRAIRATQVVYPVAADWLKSIKERVQPIHEYSDTEKQEMFIRSQRPHFWRPSDEQIKAVKRASGGSRAIADNDYLIMESLYNDLKKLREGEL